MKSSGLEFEKLCHDLLVLREFEDFGFRSPESWENAPDYVLRRRDSDTVAVVEIKFYRSLSSALGLLRAALNNLDFYAKQLGELESFRQAKIEKVLVISVLLNQARIREIRQSFGVTVFDLRSLFEFASHRVAFIGRLQTLVSDSEELSRDFVRLFSLPRSAAEEPPPSPDENLERRKAPRRGSTDPRKGSTDLCAELKSVGKDWKEYERKCAEILQKLFSKNLSGWHQQHKNDADQRFDLVCRILVVPDNEYWTHVASDFKTRFVVFEFKNYSGKVTQDEIYLTEKYLFSTALRTVAFIVSKNGPDDGAIAATKGAFRESGKLIVHLTDDDLCKMLELAERGDDPTEFIKEKIDDLLIKLVR